MLGVLLKPNFDETVGAILKKMGAQNITYDILSKHEMNINRCDEWPSFENVMNIHWEWPSDNLVWAGIVIPVHFVDGAPSLKMPDDFVQQVFDGMPEALKKRRLENYSGDV